MPPRLFFLGIDSATWELILPWVKAGKLPGFAKLLQGKGDHILESTNPPLTPVAWTSLYTGVNAGAHGIFDFYRFDEKKNLNIYLASDNPLPTIFEILSQAGKRVCVANLPFTYPVRPVNGVMLGGFLCPNLESEFIYPQSLKPEFCQRFPTYRFTEKARYGHDQRSREAYFKELLSLVKLRVKVFDWLEKQELWDLFAVNFMEVDHVQHWFFKEPEKMLAVYQEVDRYLLRKLKERRFSQYLVFSDHGAGPYHKNLNLNTYFLKTGLLKLKGAPITRLRKLLFNLGFTVSNVAQLALRLNRLPDSKSGRQTAQKMKFFLSLEDIDWERSVAFSFGYYGHVYLIKDTKLNRERVKSALLEIKYQGKPVVDAVWEREKVYSGKLAKRGPAILYSAANYAYGASAISPFLDNQVFSTPHTLKTGEHRPEGILAFFPRLKTPNPPSRISIFALSATILTFFGVSPPNYFDQKSVIETPRETEVSEITV